MPAIIDAFIRIALRRLGPEDLPDSGLLLLLAGVAYVASQVLVALPVFGFGGVLLRSLALDLAMLCGCVWAVLRFTGHPVRFRQTLTALLGTGALLGLCIVPFNYWVAAAADPAHQALAPTIGIVAIVLWSVVVNAHIMARALSAPFVLGLAISIAYFIVNYIVVSQAGPAPA